MPPLTPPSTSNDLALASRHGLPGDLLRLREKYPRDTWTGHANLGEWVCFWLERHGIFRELGAMMNDACAQLLDQQISAGEFNPWFGPRLEFFFGHLDLHHKIEEFHIFPAFARAEPALQRGFTLLESDHQEIHLLIDSLQEAAARLANAGEAASDPARRAAEDTTCELAALLQPLMAHLDDEEDLIVPIVLDHTEANLGLF